MSALRRELEDNARKVFPDWQAAQDAAGSWTQMAELGWFMAGVPEALGGLGLERRDLAVIFTEMGRARMPGPALAQFLALEALVQAPGLPRSRGAAGKRHGGRGDHDLTHHRRRWP
ncbi:acyl-CoA dehydrogenase family protein [Novosphingobium sp. MBES04]|uniref:acyl-CoA dehydrogenase family protein n=1 Tax=Novosphingobium sp. MBES04 TaxID=1206458 RepID=UPI0007234206|nr:acyl-CoA dehydrogenase family protein [Novosphingobium sp. MBES04]GAM04294.1 hypothetical protein MBENS4_1292 [Novosphingobium sp. MBES04]